jgi:Rhodopirellula transposase DDE domain
VNQSNQAADAAAEVLRLSRDAKATVNVGPCARGGKNRLQVYAADHDGAPEATGTPVGLCLPTRGALCVSGVTSTVTRDGLGERLGAWGATVRERFAHITTLGVKLDKDPEHHSQRTPLRQRLVAFVQPYQLVRLAYSPPYHRTDHPLERCGGSLENPWKGTVLDAMDPVRQFTRTRTWNGTHPVVALVTAPYQTGVTLTQDAMETVEAQRQRLPVLGKWFVDIVAPPWALRDP